MAIAGVRVMRVRVVFMPIVLLRRCRSGDGERQRRRRDRGHGQKKSAKLHGATSFNLVSRSSYARPTDQQGSDFTYRPFPVMRSARRGLARQ